MESRQPWVKVSDMLINRNRGLLFVGVYDTERFEPVSLAGSNSVRGTYNLPDGSSKDEWRIELIPAQVRALISHIKYGRTSMVRVDIARLQFVCIRNGMNALTGMSNFNMEPKTQSETDKLLFSITNEHYTRQDSLEGVHALNIAAILQDDALVVGITKDSELSVIKLLKELILMKDGKFIADAVEERVSGPEGKGALENNSISEAGRVAMRMSTKTGAEKTQDQQKRKTSFCEDWRTATIKSLEALQMMGQFSNSRDENDTLPLLDDIGVPAALDVSREEQHVHSPRNSPSTQTPETRRKSRVTIV